MTDSDSDFHVPESRIERIQYSIGNLWDDYGRTDKLGVGIVFNLGMMTAGLLLYLLVDGWLAFVGVVWALLHVYPFIKWGAQRW